MARDITHLKSLDELSEEIIFSYHLVDDISKELIGQMIIIEKFDPKEKNFVTEISDVKLPDSYAEIKKDLIDLPPMNWNIYRELLNVILKQNRISTIYNESNTNT